MRVKARGTNVLLCMESSLSKPPHPAVDTETSIGFLSRQERLGSGTLGPTEARPMLLSKDRFETQVECPFLEGRFYKNIGGKTPTRYTDMLPGLCYDLPVSQSVTKRSRIIVCMLVTLQISLAGQVMWPKARKNKLKG